MNSKLLYCLVICALLLNACVGPAVTQPVSTGPTAGAYPGAGGDSAYPAGAYPAANDQAAYPAYPYPAATIVGAETIPTPTLDASLGQVKGRLLEAGKPVQGVYVSLAAVKADENGQDLVAKSTNEDPTSSLQPDGSFLFFNVPDGRYGLIVDFVLNAFLLGDPKDQVPLLFNVVNGQTVDLGDLNYDDLPLPPTQ